MRTYKITFTKIFRSVLVLLLVIIAVACGSQEGPERGSAAPDFEVRDLDGNKVALSDYKNKVVMLYFWADWCPACKKEFPETQAYYQDLKGDDFEILAINVGQPEEASRKFRDLYKASFPMVADSDSDITKLYSVSQLPTNYFIAPDGTVARRRVGWVDKNQVRVMVNQYRKQAAK
jgi:peroxiredoxin